MAGLTREQRAARAAAEQAAAEDRLVEGVRERIAADKAAPKLVRMVRDPETSPKPHTADVHPDEVANYAAAGWWAA